MPHTAEEPDASLIHQHRPGRPFERSELEKLNKPELVALVLKQPERWPRKGKSKGINATKAKKNEILEALLNPAYGFTNGNVEEVPTDAESDDMGVEDTLVTLNSRTAESAPLAATLRQPDNGAHVPATSEHEGAKTRDLTLYIEDRRFPEVATQTMEIITVAIADRVGCGPGAWRVSAKEIVGKLQQSHGAIGGAHEFLRPVKLGVPEHNDPKSRFIRYFITAAIPGLLEALPSPEYLVVPATSKLTLCVNWAADKLAAPLLTDLAQVDNDHSRDHSPSQMLSSRSKPKKTIKKKQAVSREIDVEWLKEAAQARPGFKTFRESKGRVLQNSEILFFWDFAVQFVESYRGTTSGVSDHIITKKSILEALGLRETWYSQASLGLELALYYGEGGEECADEVVAELEEHREHPLGQVKLIEFLRNWAEKDSEGGEE
ncbi:hypothetical protein FPV67DRAFT_1677505 [Lyophyllum atratum]|nr:hypothetical protein FPV67DRAFT_1677505 [Lyophyllum atratum]